MTNQAASNQLLGSTAHWTASARAKESEREDRLFKDPYAATLAGSQGAEWIAQRGGSVASMVIRTRYFDDFLQRITQQHQIHQVVLMAAGLDTRAFRLEWPEQTRLFELDQPAVLQYKAQILQAAGAQPACARQTVAVDLTTPWKEVLVQSGLDPHEPAAWLLEGFLYYLPVERIHQILAEVSDLAAPGSWMGFDIMNGLTLTSPWTRQWVEMQAQAGAPWIGTLDDPVGVLAALGWQASVTQPGAEDANYGRWTLPVIPVKMPDMPHNWYVTAEKKTQ